MELALLGPVEVLGADGHPLPLGGPRQRALLAYLLLHANRVVSADRLVAALWEVPPGDAHAALQNQVSRLRKVLGDRLVTRAPGYVVRVEPGELDLDRFRAAVAEAGSISDLGERSRTLREADALFRGVALADVEAPFAAGESAALEELRLSAVEARIDADLERGRHAELVPEIGALVQRSPLRERLRAQYILALYRCGRQADALDAYRDTRRTLQDELGLEPGTALRELERAILTQDPALDLPAAAAGAGKAPVVAAEPPAPAQAQRRRIPALVLALGALVLAFAGGATAVVLTRSSPNVPRANAAPPASAAKHTQHAASLVKHVDVHAKPLAHHTRPAKTKTKATTAPAPARTVTVSSPAPPPASTPATNIAHTTTHPAAPKKPPAAKPAPVTTTAAAAATTTLSDDFSESAPNTTLWGINGDGSGSTWALDGGRLVFTVLASGQTGGTYDMVGPGWSSQCRFDGDFDARVDYQLLEWPAGVGGHLQLSAWIFPNLNAAAGRMINQYGDQYNGNVGQSFDLVDTTDLQGTLRLARVGNVETAYYLAKGKWVVLHSGNAPGQVQLGLQLFAQGNEWTHQEFRVALDNFSVTGTSVVCP